MRPNAWCYTHKNIVLPIRALCLFLKHTLWQMLKEQQKNQDLRWHLCRWETFFVCSCFHNFPLLWMNVTSSFTKNKFLFSNSTSSVVLWHINACYRTKQLCVSRQGLEKVYYLPGSWMLHETQLSVLSPPRAGLVWQKLQSFPKLVSLLQITAAKWQKSQHNICLCLPHSTHFHKATTMFLAVDI